MTIWVPLLSYESFFLSIVTARKITCLGYFVLDSLDLCVLVSAAVYIVLVELVFNKQSLFTDWLLLYTWEEVFLLRGEEGTFGNLVRTILCSCLEERSDGSQLFLKAVCL